MSHAPIPIFDRLKAKAKIVASGKSVAEIARAMGYERQTVGHWLRGRGEPDMRQIHLLATEIGCHWLELVSDDATVINDPAEAERVQKIRAASPQVQALIDQLLEAAAKPSQ